MEWRPIQLEAEPLSAESPGVLLTPWLWLGHWLSPLSLGVAEEWTSQRPALSQGRHPVWGQIAGPLELLNSGKYVGVSSDTCVAQAQDWVLSMDCDSLFVDLSAPLPGQF